MFGLLNGDVKKYVGDGWRKSKSNEWYKHHIGSPVKVKLVGTRVLNRKKHMVYGCVVCPHTFYARPYKIG